MYGRVFGASLLGVHGHLVTVEAHVGRGLPALSLTGLPGAAVQDARDRLRPAVEAAGLAWPLRRIVVNLAPATLRKEGSGLDLPVAMGVLAASSQVPAARLGGIVFAGELALDGSLLPTPGILSIALAAAGAGLREVVVPRANAAEAALVEGLSVVGAPGIREVVGHLRGTWRPEPVLPGPPLADERPSVDFAEIRGQVPARRALEVAAAGGHNVLMVGAPGAGKTMLARRMPTILPALSSRERLDVTQLHSVAGLLARAALVRERPFRAPHHSISPAGLLGGGSGRLRPGEASLAHHGVLFLDELTEFRRDAIEGLRQPLEDGRIVVTRAVGAVEFPARFTLVGAANPCPCGYRGDGVRECTCRSDRAQAYRDKLSGPLLDRIDLHLHVPRLSRRELLGAGLGEPSAAIRNRVEDARARQRTRYRELGIGSNAQLAGPIARRFANVSADAEALLGRAVESLALSGRGFDRALKVARTIADLGGADRVGPDHVAEALSYRVDASSQGFARAG